MTSQTSSCVRDAIDDFRVGIHPVLGRSPNYPTPVMPDSAELCHGARIHSIERYLEHPLRSELQLLNQGLCRSPGSAAVSRKLPDKSQLLHNCNVQGQLDSSGEYGDSNQ